MTVTTKQAMQNLNNVWGIGGFVKIEKPKTERTKTGFSNKTLHTVINKENFGSICMAMSMDIDAYRKKNKLLLRELANICNVGAENFGYVVRGKSTYSNETAEDVRRFLLLLKVRNVIDIPTKIILTDDRTVMDLNDSENVKLVKQKLIKFMNETDESRSSLERKAGLKSGMIAQYLARPERYLSIKATLHGYSSWISPVYLTA